MTVLLYLVDCASTGMTITNIDSILIRITVKCFQGDGCITVATVVSTLIA